jgi:hypothetical protein
MSRGRFSPKGAAGAGLLSVFALIVLGAAPAFAWTSNLTTTPGGGSGTTTRATIVQNGYQATSGTVSSSPYQVTLPAFNAGIGTNRLLVVGVEANNNYVTSVTFGGVQMTFEVQSFVNDDAEFWYLVNPSGTANIVVTMLGPTSVVLGAYAMSGVDQNNPIPTMAIAHGTSGTPTVTITTQYPNSKVIESPSIYGGVTLGSPTCTKSWDINIPSAVTGASSSTSKASAGPATCAWTASSSEQWDDAAIEIQGSATFSAPVGTPIFDTAGLTLVPVSGATSAGTIYFYLYAGTCSSVTGSPLRSSTATVGSANGGATIQYGSGSFPTTGLTAGPYVWLTKYSGGGTSPGWPAFPTSTTSGAILFNGIYYDCEPIKLTAPTPPSVGVPEFSAGLPILMALALPALLLMRRQLPKQ